MGLIAAIVENRWRPGIGDPTLVGWATVFAYAVALALCVRAFRASETRGNRQEPLWALLAMMMLVLGINKQLDLQTWFTQVGRDLAIERGWYAQRHLYQGVFLGVVALMALLAVGLCWRLAMVSRWPVTPLVGAALLASYVVIRAASFHHVDRIINLAVPGARLSSVIEIAGIAIIGVSAARASRPPRPGASTKPPSLVEIVAKFR